MSALLFLEKSSIDPCLSGTYPKIANKSHSHITLVLFKLLFLCWVSCCCWLFKRRDLVSHSPVPSWS